MTTLADVESSDDEWLDVVEETNDETNVKAVPVALPKYDYLQQRQKQLAAKKADNLAYEEQFISKHQYPPNMKHRFTTRDRAVEIIRRVNRNGLVLYNGTEEVETNIYYLKRIHITLWYILWKEFAWSDINLLRNGLRGSLTAVKNSLNVLHHTEGLNVRHFLFWLENGMSFQRMTFPIFINKMITATINHRKKIVDHVFMEIFGAERLDKFEKLRAENPEFMKLWKERFSIQQKRNDDYQKLRKFLNIAREQSYRYIYENIFMQAEFDFCQSIQKKRNCIYCASNQPCHGCGQNYPVEDCMKPKYGFRCHESVGTHFCQRCSSAHIIIKWPKLLSAWKKNEVAYKPILMKNGPYKGSLFRMVVSLQGSDTPVEDLPIFPDYKKLEAQDVHIVRTYHINDEPIFIQVGTKANGCGKNHRQLLIERANAFAKKVAKWKTQTEELRRLESDINGIYKELEGATPSSSSLEVEEYKITPTRLKNQLLEQQMKKILLLREQKEALSRRALQYMKEQQIRKREEDKAKFGIDTDSIFDKLEAAEAAEAKREQKRARRRY